ncbi:hypothetical protein HDR66_03750 [bacterium]|nr:hypothetical protein [bacterium]
MKLNSIGFLTAAAIMFCTSSAHAGLLFDPYIGATGGMGATTALVKHDNQTKFAQSYGAVLGLDIPLLRAEAEYNRIHNKDVTADVAMGNVYVKLPVALISPYIGAGVGAIFDGDAYGHSFDTTVAYQGMLGMTFNIPVLPFKIDAEARALYAPDTFTIGTSDVNILHYDVRAKIRLIF